MDILRLKELFKEKKISSKDLSLKLGITENALSMIVNGKRQPRFELLLQIAQMIDVDVRDLFNSTKETATEKLFAFRDGSYQEVGSLLKQ